MAQSTERANGREGVTPPFREGKRAGGKEGRRGRGVAERLVLTARWLLTVPLLVPNDRHGGAKRSYPWPLNEAGGLLLPGERTSVPEPDEPGCGEK